MSYQRMVTPHPNQMMSLGGLYSNVMALLSSGHAVSLPPIINDIADALYWLQDVNSPMAYSALTCNCL